MVVLALSISLSLSLYHLNYLFGCWTSHYLIIAFFNNKVQVSHAKKFKFESSHGFDANLMQTSLIVELTNKKEQIICQMDLLRHQI
jgi:hypothetical protein